MSCSRFVRLKAWVSIDLGTWKRLVSILDLIVTAFTGYIDPLLPWGGKSLVSLDSLRPFDFTLNANSKQADYFMLFGSSALPKTVDFIDFAETDFKSMEFFRFCFDVTPHTAGTPEFWFFRAWFIPWYLISVISFEIAISHSAAAATMTAVVFYFRIKWT